MSSTGDESRATFSSQLKNAIPFVRNGAINLRVKR